MTFKAHVIEVLTIWIKAVQLLPDIMWLINKVKHFNRNRNHFCCPKRLSRTWWDRATLRCLQTDRKAWLNTAAELKGLNQPQLPLVVIPSPTSVLSYSPHLDIRHLNNSQCQSNDNYLSLAFTNLHSSIHMLLSKYVPAGILWRKWRVMMSCWCSTYWGDEDWFQKGCDEQPLTGS